jgi:uncharacterized protein YbjT (DUF2867 family)
MVRLTTSDFTGDMTENTQKTPTTLVIGGTGKTGRRVVRRLRDRGVPVRVGSRAGEPPFDWDDRATWAPALRGVASVYVTYHSDVAFPGAADVVGSFARLAVETGALRLVLLSGRNEEGALRSEQLVRESGADWTIVRSSFFAQNFSEGFFLDSVLAGEVPFPAGDVTEPFIDVDDIADVAAAALTDDRHIGQLYEVTGPRLMTFADAVAGIARAVGREIRYVQVSMERYAALLGDYDLPVEFVKLMTELFSDILDGRSSYLADGVQRALGRPPRDFADYARDAAASGVWAGRPDRQCRVRSYAVDGVVAQRYRHRDHHLL